MSTFSRFEYLFRSYLSSVVDKEGDGWLRREMGGYVVIWVAKKRKWVTM